MCFITKSDFGRFIDDEWQRYANKDMASAPLLHSTNMKQTVVMWPMIISICVNLISLLRDNYKNKNLIDIIGLLNKNGIGFNSKECCEDRGDQSRMASLLRVLFEARKQFNYFFFNDLAKSWLGSYNLASTKCSC
jgi:hypothetical protein